MILDDTIVAISTPAGTAARAIVRLSGPDAIRIADAFFCAAGQGAHPGLKDLPAFHAADGVLALAQTDMQMPCRAYLFRAPRSYTRQDVVELHVPGAAAVAAALACELVGAGARPAQGGEFTARAFFSGRIDLSAAEAVADVINAADDSALRSAMAAVDGAVWRLCAEACERLAEALAGVEASIDLADEHVVLDEPPELSRRLSCVAATLRDVARRAADVSDAAEQTHVAIAGRPNVGKSSLLNCLTGTDRAIVSALAGTTRDVLSSPMTLPGGRTAILQDAAGFAAAIDTLARAADSAARRAVARADAVLFVVDASCGDFSRDWELLEELRAANPRAPRLLVINKVDLVAPPAAEKAAEALGASAERGPCARAIATSCRLGLGMEQLASALEECLHLEALRGGEAMGLHERQKRCLHAAADDADAAAELIAGAREVADVAELAAVELRDALAQLGQISGQVLTEDILGRIFSRFCVGK